MFAVGQAKLEFVTDELVEIQLPPVEYSVEEILPAGPAVFVSAPKAGRLGTPICSVPLCINAERVCKT